MKKVITKNCRLRTKGLFKIERKLIFYVLIVHTKDQGQVRSKENFSIIGGYTIVYWSCVNKRNQNWTIEPCILRQGKIEKKSPPPFTFPFCLVCYPYHPLMQKMQIIFRHQHNQIICKQTVLNQCLDIEVRNRPHVQIFLYSK